MALHEEEGLMNKTSHRGTICNGNGVRHHTRASLALPVLLSRGASPHYQCISCPRGFTQNYTLFIDPYQYLPRHYSSWQRKNVLKVMRSLIFNYNYYLSSLSKTAAWRGERACEFVHLVSKEERYYVTFLTGLT